MKTADQKHPLKVFLCHASTDKPKVRELYRYLKRRGINPWFDEEHLVGGQDWQVEIPKALATSDAIIICLTKNSVDREGYIQKEIKFALDKALEMPEGRIFLIPVKFEECEVPFTLSRYQWVDLTIESGYAKMMKALKFRASQLERSTVEVSSRDGDKENFPHEKAEKDAAEKARLKAEELARQKIAKEKAEREIVEKAPHEKVKREAGEKAALEKVELETKLKEEYEKARREQAKSEIFEKEHTIKPRPVIPKNEKQKPFKPVVEKSSINRYFPLFIIIAVGILIVSLFIYSQINKPVDFIQIEFKSRPAVNVNATGDPNAPIKIVEFSDFQSLYSSRFTQITEPQFVDEYVATGKVYFIHRSFGSFIGAESQVAAEAAYCAGDQGKFWDYHDLLYANQISENVGSFNERRLLAFAEGVELDIDIFKACVDSGKYSSQVLQDYNDGNSAGIQGVPSFLMTYVVNGQTKTKLIVGAQPFSTFQQEIDAALAEINQ